MMDHPKCVLTGASLLSALIKALEMLPAEARKDSVSILERHMPTEYHDLGEKIGIILAPGLEIRDRILALWLFFASVLKPEGRENCFFWVGPDFAGDDMEECLRYTPGTGEEIPGMKEALSILAGAFSPRAYAEFTALPGAKFSLRFAE